MEAIFRQGDVCLVPCKNIKGAVKVQNNIVAAGEKSGHHHVVVGDGQLVMNYGRMYIVTGKGRSYLAHLKASDMTQADHLPLPLMPERTYEVRIQKKFDPYANLHEVVMD